MTQSTSEEITLPINLDGYNFRATCKPMRKRLLPYLPTLRWVVFLLGLSAYIVAAQMNIRYDTDKYNNLSLPIIPAFLFFFIGGVYQIKRSWRAVASAPHRSGDFDLRLTPKGYVKTCSGYRLQIDWPLILDVIDGKDGLLLLTGDMEAEPIPASAIPNDMSQDELKTQIKIWMDTAKAK